ncbi:DUF302 domain-containing protein [Coralliovum pocilloporae]|uniref:DUF302 domain-containing protein n=1 Tax=Coralliovum pocilloporae TaxID=3066369 RepID=UPI0033078B0A
MIRKISPLSVDETLTRLAAIVEEKGATVFARINHTAGAAKIGSELRPTELLVFGNPAVGTPVMLDAQEAGLDLPLRVLCYEDETGTVRLVWHNPSDMAASHGLDADHPAIAKISGVLDALTDAAIRN